LIIFAALIMKAGPGSGDAWRLFALLIEVCLITETTRLGDPQPQHTVWKAK
jgi:hypothetical protein